MNETIIREARPEDLEGIVKMAKRMVAETKYNELIAIDPARASETIMGIATNPEGLFLIAERDGKPVGMIAMLAFSHPFSGAQVASEVVWWVEPEARGCGLRLLKKAEKWARDKGLKAMQMVAPDPAIGALYERLGYDPVETSYQRSL